MERRTYKSIVQSFMSLCSKSTSCYWIRQLLIYKHNNFFSLLKVVFHILHTKFCLGLFFKQLQLQFTFLEFEVGSDANALELSNLILLSKTKLNQVNKKVMRAYLFVKKANAQLPSSMMIIQWNLSKADSYGTEVFVRLREVSALERFELKSSQI